MRCKSFTTSHILIDVSRQHRFEGFRHPKICNVPVVFDNHGAPLLMEDELVEYKVHVKQLGDVAPLHCNLQQATWPLGNNTASHTE